MFDDMNELRLTTIADRIRWVLRSSGMTQRELARAAGLADTQISVILRRLDERPFAIELDTVIRVARGAGVSHAWLLLGQGQPYAQGSTDSEPEYAALRAFPTWQPTLTELRDQGIQLPPDLIGWVSRIAFPLDEEHRLTPQLVLDLMWVRLRLLFGPMSPAYPITLQQVGLPDRSTPTRPRLGVPRKAEPKKAAAKKRSQAPTSPPTKRRSTSR